MSHYNKDEEISPSHDSISQPGREFVPFNYSDVDYSTFLGKNKYGQNDFLNEVMLVYSSV